MEVNTTVGQRFLQFISHLGITKNAFAASLDKTATVIQHLVDERNKPGFNLLCKVFEVYPNVSKDWLLQGTGPMLVDTASIPQPVTIAPENRDNSAVVGAVEVSPKEENPVSEAPSETPVSPSPAVEPQPTSVASPAAAPLAQPIMPVPVVPAPLTSEAVTPVVSASADTSWQTALYTQQMAHQLALAELRNQHLQDQQRLMQQMLDLMQRQLPR
jgi:hypothetical protein